MKTRLAKRIGFCFGVKRAVEMAETSLKSKGPICSLGSIIHNEQVVELLSKKGLKVIKDVNKIRGGACVISSHGISPAIAWAIKKRGVRLIDTTCPFVLNAQRIAKSLSGGPYGVIIVGDAKHPEIKALVGYVQGDARVVKDARDAKRLKIGQGGKFIVISQTTQSAKNFLDTVHVISEKKPRELRIFNTICGDAEERQDAAKALAASVDVMLVVGGRNSANTKRLLEVSRSVRKKSYLIETEKDLRKRWLRHARSVGITSGASTPDWLVAKVVEKINKGRALVNSKRKGLCY